MSAKPRSFIQKMIVCMLMFVFLFTSMGTANVQTARAQEVWTETPTSPDMLDMLKPTEMPPLSTTISERSPEQRTIRLWYDTRGDLWVETPLYRWNITGGMSITALNGSKGYEWSANSQAADARVIDRLFFIDPTNTPTSTRIFYALSDEAVVYLERKTIDGVEGLEMGFRASDGLIHLTHRWQGLNPPVFPLSQQSPLLSRSPEVENQSGTFSSQGKKLNDGWSYSLSFDPVALQGQSIIRQLSIQPAQIPESSCFTDYPSTEPSVHDPCQFPNFFLPGQVLSTEYLFLYTANSTAPLKPVEMAISALQLDLPDLNVANIERTPRYDYDGAKNNPTPGDVVTFQARVANRGGQSTGVFGYAWYIDQVLAQSGTYPNLDAGEMTLLSLNWTWQDGPHTVRLDLDPTNIISEVSEQNNSVEDRTNGLVVGFWVEQSVYDYFNIHQVELGLGSVSWDDWAQRQIRIWNQMMSDAVHPLTPQGIIDRVRLDKVTVVPDGTLPHPYPGNYPANDKTVDMMWGFDAELVGPDGFYIQDPSVQNFEPSLLHELSHARYLLDLYGLDVGFGREYLNSAITSTATTLVVQNNVETVTYWTVPAYLAIEGELIVCQSKLGNSFTDCSRGIEGTIPRTHGINAIVNQAAVRLQDGQGSLILTSLAMPLVGGWDDHVYYNRYPDDMMSGGLKYETHSAYAWNRIAGQRPVCGNQNAPCNIGEYANDLPEHNVVEIHDAGGQPIYGARVELFQAKPNEGWYGKLYINTPDATYYTDALGQADLGHFPFGSGPTIIHGYGHSDANLLLKISYGEQSFYRFFEVTDANEAYWSGQRNTAIYIFATGITYNCASVTEISQAECRALVALYNNTNGPNWHDNTNWLETNTPCSWYGVSCSGGRIVSLSLSGNQLTGSIPMELGNLTQLGLLYLEFNQISGEFPASITNLVNLTSLTFDCGLTSTDPVVIAFLNNLVPDWQSRCYTISGNVGIGNVVFSYTDNTPKTATSAGDGSYSFSIPSGWTGTVIPSKAGFTFIPVNRSYTNVLADMTGEDYTAMLDCTGVTEIPQVECLALVSLYNNTNGPNWYNSTNWLLTNTPCSWYGVWCNGVHISYLNLYNNHLTGSIPTQLDNLTNLNYLYLSYNQLDGSIPAQLGNLTQLTNLKLSNNQLTGSIPVELGNLTQLTDLSLSYNQLTGSIPTQLGNLTKLSYLWLNNNQLTGNIPAGLGNLTQITEIWLDNNQLTGGIPTQLGNLSQLTWLVLDGNQLSGNIPTQLGNLTSLKRLYLYDNLLTGNIPPELGNLAQLIVVELSRNQLTGSIPGQLGNLTRLEYLLLNNNQLSGSIPPELGNLTELTGLWLNNNQLSGEFPLSITKLVNLTTLTFDCGLTSSDPAVIAFLNNLVPGWQNRCSISISGNAGTGTVTLSYVDGIPKTATADTSGNYFFAVSYNWSGTVTPSLAGYTFTPVNRTYANVVANQTGQNYTASPVIQTATFTSTAANDGWVLESSETSNKGGSFDAKGKTFQLGDDAQDRQYKAILSFNTTGLPDNAVIQSVALKIKQSGAPVGSNPFKILGALLVDIRKGSFGGANALVAADFQASPSAKKVATFNKTPAAGWYSATLNLTGRNNINKVGVTQFRLYFTKDDNDDLGADFMKFVSGNNATMKPQLIITYTVP